MKYVLLLFGLLLSAQEKASFYFDFDQDTFNPKQNELFMSWLNKDQNREILVINGYCDWYGTFDYNDTLGNILGFRNVGDTFYLPFNS